MKEIVALYSAPAARRGAAAALRADARAAAAGRHDGKPPRTVINLTAGQRREITKR
jgi:hypothetical protein